jgi:hypothetical protein
LFPPDPALPPPAPEAQAHSQALRERIGEVIAESGGWIGFDRYMDLALYAPGLGYYAGGAAKLGASGDFVTAPELSSLFSATLARQLAELLPLVGGDVLELGAGSGRMAADLLLALDAWAVPARYLIVELSTCGPASSTHRRAAGSCAAACSGWTDCPSASSERSWPTSSMRSCT